MTALPQLFSKRTEAFLTAAGTIVFHIGDSDSYTVRMGDTSEPVSEGADEASDLQVFFTSDAFQGLMNGTLNVKEAVQSEQIRSEGDGDLFSALGHLLQAPTSGLNARIGQMMG
ncbi:MAG: hypothetical protein CMH56_01475 [Myxococcales bacterium]|nr:hypothetical protein [Myxococcales bacterium]